MADGTAIEWTDATWNVVNGCSVVSPGCTNCYAMRLAGTRLKHHASRAGLTVDTKAGPVWTGETRFNEAVLLDPLKWKRPRRIFVCAHGDLFHESVTDDIIDRVFAVMALAPQHQFQVLTKRPERMRAWFDRYDAADDHNCADMVADAIAVQLGRPDARGADRGGPDHWPLPNVWLGVSVEDQARANERIPVLLDTPAAVRWLSCEPLLGPVDLDLAWHGESALDSECWGECNWCRLGKGFPPLWNCQAGRQTDADHAKMRSGIDWVVAGGESGPGARPMRPDWVRLLRDQCAGAGVPFFFKQWGAFAPGEIAGEFLNPDRPAKGLSWFDGRWDECWSEPDGHFDDEPDVYPLGKKRAGRLLDGELHDGFPA